MSNSITRLPVSRSAPEIDSSIDCQTVWGGRATGHSLYRRPGIDVGLAGVANADIRRGGGEWRFLSSCASGRITRFVLADVCGRDQGAQEMAVALKDLLKEHVNSIRHGRLAQRMHGHFCEGCVEGTFAAAVMVTYFQPTRSLAICNAGCPPALLFRRADQRWHIITGESVSSDSAPDRALRAPTAEYRHFTTQLDYGDRIVICGTSVLESTNRAGRTFGMERWRELVEKLEGRPSKDLAGELLEALCAENAANAADQDLTIMAAEVTRTRVSWRRNILAPVRLFSKVNDHATV